MFPIPGYAGRWPASARQRVESLSFLGTRAAGPLSHVNEGNPRHSWVRGPLARFRTSTKGILVIPGFAGRWPASARQRVESSSFLGSRAAGPLQCKRTASSNAGYLTMLYGNLTTTGGRLLACTVRVPKQP
jgi:hypothetical protein